MISPVDVSAQVVKSLVSHAAHLFGGEWQTPPRAVVGVPARFNKYQREATVRRDKQDIEGSIASKMRAAMTKITRTAKTRMSFVSNHAHIYSFLRAATLPN